MVNYDLCHFNENMILSKISLLLILNGKNSVCCNSATKMFQKLFTTTLLLDLSHLELHFLEKFQSTVLVFENILYVHLISFSSGLYGALKSYS